MDSFFKNALKVFSDYCITLLIFVIFIYPVLSFAKANYLTWVAVYSFVIFLLLYKLLFADLKTIAIKQKRPQYNLHPHPLNGLLFGLAGFIPVVILEIVYLFLHFNVDTYNRIAHIALNIILGPEYWFVKVLGSSAAAYIAATLLVPVICMLGYLAGFYNWNLSLFKKKDARNVKDQSTAKKS